MIVYSRGPIKEDKFKHSMELDNEIKRLRGLTQYRNLPEQELIQLAKEKILEHSVDLSGAYIDAKEKKLAKSLLHKYLQDFDLQTVSDKNTLQQLIELEVIHNRLQKILNKAHKDKGTTPMNMVDTIHKNINEITLLKDKLGISKDKRSAEEIDTYNALELLKKKYKTWREENQGSRTMTCPHCGKFTLLKIKMDAWIAQKHPFFKDRILYNPYLFKLYREKKLTRHEVALVLETSDDYIDFIMEKVEKPNEQK